MAEPTTINPSSLPRGATIRHVPFQNLKLGQRIVKVLAQAHFYTINMIFGLAVNIKNNVDALYKSLKIAQFAIILTERTGAIAQFALKAFHGVSIGDALQVFTLVPYFFKKTDGLRADWTNNHVYQSNPSKACLTSSKLNIFKNIGLTFACGAGFYFYLASIKLLDMGKHAAKIGTCPYLTKVVKFGLGRILNVALAGAFTLQAIFAIIKLSRTDAKIVNLQIRRVRAQLAQPEIDAAKSDYARGEITKATLKDRIGRIFITDNQIYTRLWDELVQKNKASLAKEMAYAEQVNADAWVALRQRNPKTKADKQAYKVEKARLEKAVDDSAKSYTNEQIGEKLLKKKANQTIESVNEQKIDIIKEALLQEAKEVKKEAVWELIVAAAEIAAAVTAIVLGVLSGAAIIAAIVAAAIGISYAVYKFAVEQAKKEQQKQANTALFINTVTA
ncbi:hypothetical protein BN1013_00969 [Candidatus Rubidus massiliensis]|nr:hypothetical protein BN1013_00969 [Candidatus Rubidus massiliensis]